jgi:hypothetical protein
MNGLLVTIGIIVGMSILGYLTQALKRASDRRMEERERERQRERRANAALANPNVSSRNDLDRYIQAVEAQRQRPVSPARPAQRATPVPTVQPTRKKARTDDAPTAFPAAKLRGAATPPVVPDDLPMATVVTPRGSVPTAAPVQRPEKAATLTASKSTRSNTPFARRLTALLSSPDATALAVVLHEVLGPPKCKQQEKTDSPPRAQEGT